MTEEGFKPIEKRVDERWKDEVDKERKKPAVSPPAASQPAPSHTSPPPAPEEEEPRLDTGLPEPNFSVFLSSLSMQAMMALGELPLPGTNQRHEDLEQARYLIDTLGMLQQKTKGNLTPEESQFLENALYELRLRYTQKTMPPIPPPPGGGRR